MEISLSKIIIGAAHVCDFIPVVSTGTNIFALFKKRAYRLAVADGDINIKSSQYYTYLKSKPPIRCLYLMIPGFNFFFAIYYAYKNHKTVITPPLCPITNMPFKRPLILLEDGFTYDEYAINAWFKIAPNNSPMIGTLPSATLRPNFAVSKGIAICPITQKPFREPYYCLEDGQTYEKDAILQWYEVQIKEGLALEKATLNTVTIRSPVTRKRIHSLTLYPNKILFEKRNSSKSESAWVSHKK